MILGMIVGMHNISGVIMPPMAAQDSVVSLP